MGFLFVNNLDFKLNVIFLSWCFWSIFKWLVFIRVFNLDILFRSRAFSFFLNLSFKIVHHFTKISLLKILFIFLGILFFLSYCFLLSLFKFLLFFEVLHSRLLKFFSLFISFLGGSSLSLSGKFCFFSILLSFLCLSFSFILFLNCTLSFKLLLLNLSLFIDHVLSNFSSFLLSKVLSLF